MTATIMNSAHNYNTYSDDATYRDYDDSGVDDESTLPNDKKMPTTTMKMPPPTMMPKTAMTNH